MHTIVCIAIVHTTLEYRMTTLASMHTTLVGTSVCRREYIYMDTYCMRRSPPRIYDDTSKYSYYY